LIRDRDQIPVRGDSALWAALIDDHLPPRALWPRLVHRLPALQYPGTLNLAEALLAIADRSPRATAVIWRGERLSYRELRERTLSAAGALTRLGVQPADRVAFRFHNTPEFITSWLAVQWVGAIGVPIPAIYRRREIAHIVNHSGAVFVIVSADLRADVESAAGEFRDPSIRVVTGLTEAGVPPPPYPTGCDFPALITYITSVTTALKGVVHSPAEILSTADTYARDVLNLTADDICIGLSPMAWSFGLGALLVFPLRVGASTVLVETAGPSLPAVIADTRATVLFSAPTLYRLLLRRPDLESFDFSSLRRCVSAAEPLPATIVREWLARTGLEILDGLGTTELAHIFISARAGSVRPGVIGDVVAGYDARIVGDDSRELPSGVPGLLAVRGPTGARYWRDPDAQAAAVREGWTLTGDVCTRGADGSFVHIRRVDDLIVSGGYKISTGEVERALLDHPDVTLARVFAVGDPVRGAVPHATVTLRPGADPIGAPERLQQYLKQELAPYKCPKAIEVRVESLD
jgi:2-aminobenzoate-CoA ligase